jgi:hypothetical protein
MAFSKANRAPSQGIRTIEVTSMEGTQQILDIRGVMTMVPPCSECSDRLLSTASWQL